MLLILLFFVAGAALCAIGIVADRTDHDCISILGYVIGCMLFIAFVVSGICAVFTNIHVDADTEVWKQRYEAIYYQADQKMYNNDNEVGKKELADQIMEWNEDLAEYSVLHESPWVSVFYPIDTDEFWLIPLKLLE